MKFAEGNKLDKVVSRKVSGLFVLLFQLRRYRLLLSSLIRRDIAMRFRQSIFSSFWLVLQPLFMLLVYSFVFEVVMRVRWHEASFENKKIPIGLILFSGLSAYTLFAETLMRCPAIISSSTSYVKKIVFPLALLPMVVVFSAVIMGVISFSVVAIATLFIVGSLPLFLPAIIIPIIALTFMSLGIGWFLAALGVYFRDINQLMPFISTIILFTAPICYPTDIVPKQFRFLMEINPLTVPVGAIHTMFFGGVIDFYSLGAYCITSVVVMFCGYAFFKKLRQGFADVL